MIQNWPRGLGIRDPGPLGPPHGTTIAKNGTLDDLPITYLVMDRSARHSLVTSQVFGVATPFLHVAESRAQTLDAVVVKVRDGGGAYYCAEVLR